MIVVNVSCTFTKTEWHCTQNTATNYRRHRRVVYTRSGIYNSLRIAYQNNLKKTIDRVIFFIAVKNGFHVRIIINNAGRTRGILLIFFPLNININIVDENIMRF